ncbi:pyrimidine nucleotide-sugar transmembrane transporter [Aureococcus anophagefferens]|nr:pyrimidine nucleotide-sugar transmembrane transporter [Aureococcus anophagefferens]
MDDPKPATARLAVLAAMLFQNVAYTLLRRYSQGVLHENYTEDPLHGGLLRGLPEARARRRSGALASLTVGAILVSRSALGGGGAAEDAGDRRVAVVGLAAVLTEVTLSGFASAYFEGVIKASGKRLTIFDRNFQLGLHSLLLYGAVIAVEGGGPPSFRASPAAARSSRSARRAACWSR